jgi:8-oxo-dGTP pyrophosphatase MutT (NUDIX family)
VALDLGREGLVAELRRRLAARTPRTAEAPGFQRAAVLVPLLFKERAPHVLFTQRSQYVATHKGQISFPGGVIETSDAGAAAAALRETEEEIGIRAEQVEVLGRLDELPTNTSSFVITPFVGTIPAGAASLTSDLEVARIIEVPLAVLLDPSNRETDPRTGNWQYLWEDAVIWGATARILSGLLSILSP